ncbi:MAG: prepilin-type N-terminal cleavage/methylation domain-containing protein [Lachnospiraceae bacterium]|nr:prepilin-type N-terminal cleavage/methylation domain-containing protein [Lachnospiraceae bacterium]
MKKNRKKNRGFSLVELIIVIAIMAIMAVVLVPKYLKYVDKAEAVSDIEYATRIGRALEAQIADDATKEKESEKGLTLPIPTDRYSGISPELRGTINQTWTYADTKTRETMEGIIGYYPGGSSESRSYAKLRVKDSKGNYRRYQYKVFVTEQGKARIAVYYDSSVDGYKEYELYPNVTEGCPWDVN